MIMSDSKQPKSPIDYPPPKNSINADKDLGWVRRLLPVARSHRKPLVLGICVGVVALILNVAVPAIAKEAIDSTIGGDRRNLTIWHLFLLLLALDDFSRGLYTEFPYLGGMGC